MPTEPYLSLLCDDIGRTALELFGVQDPSPSVLRATFTATSHQFVTTYLGPEGIKAVRAATDSEAAVVLGVECSRMRLDGGAELYLFDHGAAIFHVVEAVEFAYIAELARWRAQSYRVALDRASGQLSRAAGYDVAAGYVFSVYMIDRPRWSSDQLCTAVKLMSVPKVVLADAGGDFTGNAEALEERMLVEGFEDARIIDYGYAGVSIGFASWSAVAYLPLVPSRALDARDHVDVELIVQSTWATCRALLDRIEAGDDLPGDEAALRRYLRAMRSKASAPKATESGQSLAMRRAIFATSHLEDQVTGVLSCL